MWDTYFHSLDRWRHTGDVRRQAMAEFFQQGWQCHEQDPEQSYILFTRGRDEASALNEPWWVLFYEAWRLTTLTSHSMDFTRALPLAVQLLVRLETPVARTHEWRHDILTNAVYTWVCTDAAGYRPDIEASLAYLEQEKATDEDRYVLAHRRLRFHMNLEEWGPAYAIALQALSFVDKDAEARVWHGAWYLYEACQICDTLGDGGRLADHSEHLAELSGRHPQLRRTRAAADCWRAVVRRRRGDEPGARQAFQSGLRLLRGLYRRDSICADALARYFELGGDLAAALRVREREYADAASHGQLLPAALVQVECIRLRAAQKTLTAADLTVAREFTTKLRKPEWVLGKLAQFAPAEGTDEGGTSREPMTS